MHATEKETEDYVSVRPDTGNNNQKIDLSEIELSTEPICKNLCKAFTASY